MKITFAKRLFLLALLCLKSPKMQAVKCIACYKVHSEKAKKAYCPLFNQEVKYSKWQGKIKRNRVRKWHFVNWWKTKIHTYIHVVQKPYTKTIVWKYLRVINVMCKVRRNSVCLKDICLVEKYKNINRFLHPSILKITDIFHECEKFRLFPIGLQRNKGKRWRISHTSERYPDLYFRQYIRYFSYIKYDTAKILLEVALNANIPCGSILSLIQSWRIATNKSSFFSIYLTFEHLIFHFNWVHIPSALFQENQIRIRLAVFPSVIKVIQLNFLILNLDKSFLQIAKSKNLVCL